LHAAASLVESQRLRMHSCLLGRDQTNVDDELRRRLQEAATS
jgi:hypothetical protein